MEILCLQCVQQFMQHEGRDASPRTSFYCELLIPFGEITLLSMTVYIVLEIILTYFEAEPWLKPTLVYSYRIEDGVKLIYIRLNLRYKHIKINGCVSEPFTY